MHRWSRGGSGTRDNDSGNGEEPLAHASEAQALLDAIPAAVPVLHRGSRGNSGPGDYDSGSGEEPIADASEAKAPAQRVSAAEPMRHCFPLRADTQKVARAFVKESFVHSLVHRPKLDQVVKAVGLTIWSMLIGLTTWSMLGLNPISSHPGFPVPWLPVPRSSDHLTRRSQALPAPQMLAPQGRGRLDQLVDATESLPLRAGYTKRFCMGLPTGATRCPIGFSSR